VEAERPKSNIEHPTSNASARQSQGERQLQGKNNKSQLFFDRLSIPGQAIRPTSGDQS
jgi:hypothetical protein